MLIGLTQQYDKLLFSALTPYFLSLRTSPQTGVAIPQLEGKCIDNCPTERGNIAIFGGNRYLIPFNRGIATTSVRTGLAMTGNLGHSPTNTNLPIPRNGSLLRENSRRIVIIPEKSTCSHSAGAGASYHVVSFSFFAAEDLLRLLRRRGRVGSSGSAFSARRA